jgi:hypothetical protein
VPPASRSSLKAVDAAGDLALRRWRRARRASKREQAALDLGDLLVTQLMLIDDALVERLHRSRPRRSPSWCSTSSATRPTRSQALGGDAPRVKRRYYDIDATGDVVADVDRDVVRAATT